MLGIDEMYEDYKMNNFLAKSLLALMLATASDITLSEDIDLYISDVVRQAGKSTKVLIIFDTSGSMGDVHTVSAKFDPELTYPATDSAHAYQDLALYFNKGGIDNNTTIPSHHNDARRFDAVINSCKKSIDILAAEGYYTGHIREYTYKGHKGTWGEIRDNNSLSGIEIIDCEDDAYIIDSEGVVDLGSTYNAEGLLPGYPVNDLGTKKSPISHNPLKTTTNVDWASASYVTLYTAKYLRWYHGQTVGNLTETLMDTAITSISGVIKTTPSVDFGLELFNFNAGDGSASGNGGRIVLGIQKMTTSNKADLLNIINNQITPNGATPLCESVYEASQYFAGAGVEFGDDDINYPSYNYHKNRPPPDTDIVKSNGDYLSPFNNCASSIAHIILITDGVPTNDHRADSKITALKTKVLRVDSNGTPVYDANGQPIYDDKNFIGSSYHWNNYSKDDSYLPALAGWMSEYDINTNLDGKQTVVTHTIGFSGGADAARSLLVETARQGKGEYFHADSGLQLTQALISILNRLPQSNDRLASASVAANSFDRTQTLDSVYYAMFEPQTGARWQGNLKKYKVKDGKITGVGGTEAICEVNDRNTFCQNAQSFWSPQVDGDIVGKGGVVAWFNSQKPSDRTLYMDGGVGSLITFDRTNLEAAFTDADTGVVSLAAMLGVADLVDSNGDSIESAAVDEMLAWATGADVDDENNDNEFDDMRADVFGDPLHSKPLVVNYGTSIRIVIGTNSGALHMFKDSGATVEESWAFMPKEFIHNIKPLRDNYASSNKVYGIDGEITLHLYDKNGNGKIDSGTDKAWIFFGLRRGGSSYYALDITTPDAPKLMWHIDSGTDGFEELGQSWSQPKVGYSALNTSGDTASPVLFIGGGYDVNKDSDGLATSDTKGRAIYMLDAETGNILWSALPQNGTTVFPGSHSIASAIGLLDSTGNGLVDRLYIGDTGGSIWRVDMPDEDTKHISVFELATFGGGDDDQRFFYEPTIVRALISEIIETEVSDGQGGKKTITVHQEIPYDAVLIGSGDRSDPLGTDTSDTLYMIKDSNIITQTFSDSSTPPVPTAGFTKDDLYPYTYDPFGNASTPQAKADLQLLVSKKSGWYIDLLQSGEKATAAGLVINGIAYFTTYTPAPDGTIIDCKPPEGSGWLYAVDLALGIRKNLYLQDVRDDDNRVYKINNDWLGAPTLIVIPESDGDPTTVDKAKGDIIVGDEVINVGFSLGTTRTYLYSTENQ